MIVAGTAVRTWTIAIAFAFLVGVAAGAHAEPSMSLNGRAGWETLGYPDAATRGGRWENFFALELRTRGQLTSTLGFAGEARVVADDTEYTAGVWSLRNSGVRRPYLSLTTATLDWRPTPELRVSVGKQIVEWDVFDGVQPANLLSSRDQSDPFRAVAQGVNGFTIHYQPGAYYLDFTVVPLAFTPARSPQDRWIIIPDAVPYHQHLDPVQVDETQAGLRLGGRLGDLDASMFGYVGRDPLPLFVLNFERLTVESRSPRMHAGGMNASYPLHERLLLRFETVYFGSPDPTRGDFLDTLGGAEWAFGDWRVVVGYLRQDRTGRPDVSVLSQGERVFFQSFVSGEVRWDAGDRFEAHVRGGYDTRGEFVLLEPEVSYRLWRGLRAAVSGLLVASGRDNTYFQRIRHEDRLGMRMEYQF